MRSDCVRRELRPTQVGGGMLRETAAPFTNAEITNLKGLRPLRDLRSIASGEDRPIQRLFTLRQKAHRFTLSLQAQY